MNKKQREFEDVQKAVERYRKLSTEKILQRLNTGFITQEGRKAYNVVLKERGVKF
jgi:hypothetical protein